MEKNKISKKIYVSIHNDGLDVIESTSEGDIISKHSILIEKEKVLNKIVTDFQFRTEQGDEVYGENYQLHVVSMPKIMDKYNNHEELTTFEKLILIIYLDDAEFIEKLVGDDEMLQNALEQINELKTHKE